MAWHGQLDLHYRRDADDPRQRTIAHDRHDGPLRVLQALYPEGDSICHHVLVHPPGGVVGGDVLNIAARVDCGAHALITTPGATRFYRSAGEHALQTVSADVADGARLEWLPLESIAHSGCIAENRMQFNLQDGGEMIGWDVLALGLPASNLAFERGSFTQRIEFPGRWLERGVMNANDVRLLDSAVGWAGHRVMGSLWFAVGGHLAAQRRDDLIDSARGVIEGNALRTTAGVTSAHEGIIVLRALAHRVEPLMQLMTAVWAGWRRIAWQLDAPPPRVWRT
jgi:urease accessory protein